MSISGECPTPINSGKKILLAHGGGARLTRQLIDSLFRPAFENSHLETNHDGAVLPLDTGALVMTTDSYVVQPLFFPGGDIGSLSINGTVNDLAMCGARPLYLSVAFIIEEGLALEILEAVVSSMKKAVLQADVKIVTGDTKVVPKGKGDGMFINTTGVGIKECAMEIHPGKIQPGDIVILSGDIGRHGMAVMAARDSLSFENPIESDCAPVSREVLKMLGEGVGIHCLRDLTRGGLATALIEIAQTAGATIHVNENDIPVQENVKGACEIMGFDPLYVANEGCFVAIVPASDAKKALSILNSKEPGRNARIIGEVEKVSEGLVILNTQIGSSRILDLQSGEQLPRIC